MIENQKYQSYLTNLELSYIYIKRIKNLKKIFKMTEVINIFKFYYSLSILTDGVNVLNQGSDRTNSAITFGQINQSQFIILPLEFN